MVKGGHHLRNRLDKPPTPTPTPTPHPPPPTPTPNYDSRASVEQEAFGDREHIPNP